MRLENLISQLKTPAIDIFEDLDDTDYSTLDTFGVLYGRLLLTKSNVESTSRADELTAVDILNDYLGVQGKFHGLLYESLTRLITAV